VSWHSKAVHITCGQLLPIHPTILKKNSCSSQATCIFYTRTRTRRNKNDPITGHMPPSNNASDWSANGAPRKNSIPVRCVHLSIFAICIDVLFLLRLMQLYIDLPKSLSRQELIASSLQDLIKQEIKFHQKPINTTMHSQNKSNA